MTAIPSTGKDVVTEVGEWLGGEFASLCGSKSRSPVLTSGFTRLVRIR
ncbi:MULTISPECIES: hypothetical protein [unclassified Amycolatopsis]|nr:MULTISPECIES: hypothetical protein [unclassified Amycolatopsis]